jgi:hypothetical protein
VDFDRLNRLTERTFRAFARSRALCDQAEAARQSARVNRNYWAALRRERPRGAGPGGVLGK